MDDPSDLGFDHEPTLPVAISRVGGRYLLFDIKIATFLRREHHICGTTIGTLPLSPSQNLFLGMPIEIMSEEAQLLVEKGVGAIVDDAELHDRAVRDQDAGRARRNEYLSQIERQSRQVELVRAREKEQSKLRALGKRSQTSRSGASTPTNPKGQADRSLLDFDEAEQQSAPATTSELASITSDAPAAVVDEADDSPVKNLPTTSVSNTYQITPATSRLLLPPQTASQSSSSSSLANVPSSYPLYRHLHSQGFFLTPGLRFGCQYTVYPGDPLRFHSHFLASGTQWDEEIDLMDIVGGGRLGTGVKKGFLLGGESPTGSVRTFSVEWAVM